MNTTQSSIREFFKNAKPKDFITPGALFVLFIIVAIFFTLATKYISRKINDIFAAESRVVTTVLNQEPYAFALKRLHITPNVPTTTENPAESETIPEEQATTTEQTTTSAEQTVTLDKGSITLTVLNSTTKKGIASTLAKALEQAGYATPTTGNKSGSYANTTILVKQSKYDYAEGILEVVRKSYPGAIATTTKETASFDATIIIGAK